MTPAAAPLEAHLEDLLSEDVASVRVRERSMFDQILAKVNGRIVLFGAGSLGRSALRCLERDGIRPLAFCDNNKAIWDTEIEGIPVVSPVNAAVCFGGNAAFFVTIWIPGHRYVETHDRLTAAGCKYVYPAAPLRWKYAEELLPFFLQDLPHKVYEDAAAVRAAFQLWSDERSCAEYLAQVRYRALGDFYGLSAPDSEPSYFLESLFELKTGEVFVDCGAYDGDTVREVLHRIGDGFSRIVALEPDPKSFQCLERHIASLPAEVASRISVQPYAISSIPGRVRFNSNGGVTAAISETGDVWVDTRPLDEMLQGIEPSFIKMDIEGAEVDALESGRQTIGRHRPILAICVYHRQSDLWRIPLLIHSINPGYRYYLRMHDPEGWQTVCYALPPDRLRRGIA